MEITEGVGPGGAAPEVGVVVVLAVAESKEEVDVTSLETAAT